MVFDMRTSFYGVGLSDCRHRFVCLAYTLTSGSFRVVSLGEGGPALLLLYIATGVLKPADRARAPSLICSWEKNLLCTCYYT